MALAPAKIATTRIIAPKYWSISPARAVSKALSIMRRTAIGTARVAAAATVSAMRAAVARARYRATNGTSPNSGRTLRRRSTGSAALGASAATGSTSDLVATLIKGTRWRHGGRTMPRRSSPDNRHRRAKQRTRQILYLRERRAIEPASLCHNLQVRHWAAPKESGHETRNSPRLSHDQ